MTEVKFKDEKVWIAVIIVIIIALGFLVYITYRPKPEPTNVEVTSVSADWSRIALGTDAMVVSVSIFNHGGSGTVTVWAEVSQDYTWKKAETVSIDSRET